VGLLLPSYAQGLARYAGESEAPGLWRGLVAYVPLLAVNIKEARDLSHNRIATLTGAVAADWDVSAQGRTLQLTKTVPNYITLTNNAGFLSSWDKTTMVLWTTTESQPSSSDTLCGIGQSSNSTKVIYLRQSSSGVNRYFGTSFSASAGPVTLGFGGFMCLAVVERSSTSRALWANGKEIATNSSAVTYSGTSDTFRVGALPRSSATEPSTQTVLAAALWDRVLTADELRRCYTDPFALIRLRRRAFRPPAAVAGGGMLFDQQPLTGGMRELAGGMTG